MDKTYYETVNKLEKMGAHPDYIQGWEGGYMHNPKREEQRVTEPYDAGYQDGLNKSTDNAANWVKQ